MTDVRVFNYTTIKYFVLKLLLFSKTDASYFYFQTLPGKQQPRPSFGAAGTSGAANDVQKFNMSKSATLPLPGNFQGTCTCVL